VFWAQAPPRRLLRCKVQFDGRLSLPFLFLLALVVSLIEPATLYAPSLYYLLASFGANFIPPAVRCTSHSGRNPGEYYLPFRRLASSRPVQDLPSSYLTTHISSTYAHVRSLAALLFWAPASQRHLLHYKVQSDNTRHFRSGASAAPQGCTFQEYIVEPSAHGRAVLRDPTSRLWRTAVVAGTPGSSPLWASSTHFRGLRNKSFRSPRVKRPMKSMLSMS
jgi:hypothetical protein